MEMLGGRKIDYRPPKETVPGVHGFLLFTCIFMVFIGPGLLFYAYFMQSGTIDLSNINLFGALGFIQDLLTAAFGIVAGILLWSKKRVGLFLARIFFIFRGSAGLMLIAANSLVYFSGQYPEDAVPFESGIKYLLIGMAVSVAFIIYLFLSARVRITYAKSASSSEEPAVEKQDQTP